MVDHSSNAALAVLESVTLLLISKGLLSKEEVVEAIEIATEALSERASGHDLSAIHRFARSAQVATRPEEYSAA